MKLALVTLPPSATSGVGRLAGRLVPHLAERVELRVFVERGREGEPLASGRTEAADGLLPREHDQLLFQVANEAGCGFMAGMLRELGGAVALHDWGLAKLALAAYPELSKGGAWGTVRAVREGGLEQARRWSRLRAGEPADPPPLNRSIVRFADSFFVTASGDRERILAERNAPTPIALVESDEGAAVAELYLEALEQFPRPRSAKQRLLWRRIRGELARR